MAVQTLNPPRWQISEKRREAIAGYLFILPTYLGFLVFILGPIFGAAGISLTKFSIIGETTFIGLDNYARMMTDPRLRTVYG
ncbi:MAG: sugar ABC transporter permease, partial [Anaerolineae bacterium]|nr:sugar ABC transporter permease [Anaerolineae bacterium]